MSRDDKIVAEAKDCYKIGHDFEAVFRDLYVQDTKFKWGDSDNGWQWPSDIWQARTSQINKRPALTVNKVAPMCAQITNEARKNKTSVNIKPANSLASFKSAEMFEGLMRNIEYTSHAQTIYYDAFESTVDGGIAYWRINTKFVDSDDPDDAFNQVIVIEPFRDQMSVMLDPFIKLKSGLDANWGLVFEDLPNKEFERVYPGVDAGEPTGVDEETAWVTSETTRVAEFYRIIEEKDEWIYMQDAAGNASTFRRSEVPSELRGGLSAADKEYGEDGSDSKFRRRKVVFRRLEWYKIAASTVIGRRKLKGSYVPIVRLVGRERVIEGKLQRKGQVRDMKDSQRMYNYSSSAYVETGALAPKARVMGPAKAFAGNEAMWNAANVTNSAYLTYNHVDEEGQPLPKPEMIEPTRGLPVYLEGMKIASSEIEMAGGFSATQQPNPNIERTPKAIAVREQMGETASADFNENLMTALRATGEIVIDLAPHVYDTERVIQILGKDGTETELVVSPEAKAAYQEEKTDADAIRVLWNPRVGKYRVEADVGPAYATQRQEAFNAFVQITTADNSLIQDIGDYMFMSADFPLADKIAERLKRKIRKERPWLLDDSAPTPEQQEQQKQIEALTQQVAELLQQLAGKELQLKGKSEKRDIEAYRAESDRAAKEANMIKDLLEAGDEQTMGLLKGLIQETLRQMQETGDISADINRTQAEQNAGGSQIDGGAMGPLNGGGPGVV